MFKPVCEDTLIEEGLITKDKIRNYSLTEASLRFVLKVYSLVTYQPYVYNVYGTFKQTTDCYLTDKGLEYVYDFVRSKSLDFLRKTFCTSFAKATDEDIKHPETYGRFNNFRGTTGYKGGRGTKQKAIVTRTVNRTCRTYEFDNIKEARCFLNNQLKYHPPDEFKIYRVRTQKGKGTWKEAIPLIVTHKGYDSARDI